jgi:hypothetical protein
MAHATCWSRRELISRSYAWFGAFPRVLRGELLEAAGALAEAGHSLDGWAGLTVSPGLNGFGQRFRGELSHRSGVVFLTGVGLGGSTLSDDVLRWAYLLVGLQIGIPLGRRGSLMEITGRCRALSGSDDGDDSPETTFHTDSDERTIPDVVGVLCLNPASTGGECQIASATLAHELLKVRCRDLLGELYEPFLRHDDASAGRPIFTTVGQTLRFDYMRHGIEAAHLKSGRPLGERQRWSLDRLDQALTDPLAHLQLQMKRGEMLFINNRHIAHNRQSFVDHPEPARRRHMVRMWLSFGAGNDVQPVRGA